MPNEWNHSVERISAKNEFLLRVELFCAEDIDIDLDNRYVIKFGVTNGDYTDWVGDEYDAADLLLLGAEGLTLFDGESSPRKLNKGDNLIFNITRYGTPTIDIRDISGRILIGRSGSETRWVPLFSGINQVGADIADQINSSGASSRVLTVNFNEKTEIPDDPFVDFYGLYSHEESSGTGGGTATSGSRETRTLNTVTTAIAGSSLSSNVLTLPAGTYRVNIRTPFYRTHSSISYLYDVDNSTDLVTGSMSRSSTNGTNSTMVDSWVIGGFVLNNDTQVRIESEVETTRSTDGYGHAHTFGTNVYTVMEIWRLA